jgi:hypothetical protein
MLALQFLAHHVGVAAVLPEALGQPVLQPLQPARRIRAAITRRATGRDD